ncbi:MAG: AmmeMemoRadiSam system radical SAM enzyme [Bacteroidales bacterium]|nr:AmmeMemoRadiSam system radical SAM enzyme [Bacteroidales bacterium]
MDKRKFVKLGMLGSAGLFCYSQNLNGERQPVNNLKNLDISNSELWKWSKEGMYYEKTPRGVKCLICPNECTLKEGELSDCRNRINENNTLYTIAYGNPCAVHIDPIEKKPLFHFLPSTMAYSVATAGCNLACLNCQNWMISQTSPKKTRNSDLMPKVLVQKATENNCKSIAYTYSEPITFFEYMYDTAKLARAQGIKNVWVSNGYINEKPLRELSKYIDAANIDLKAFSNSTYLKLTSGTLDPVLNTLKTLKAEDVWFEITNLIVPGWTDDFEMIRKMCDWLYDNELYDYPLHFSRFHPQYKLTQLPATAVSVLEKARKIAMDSGIKFVYIGNVPGTNAENTYCPECKKLVIERKGYHILTNNLNNNGACNHCQTKINGRWTL